MSLKPFDERAAAESAQRERDRVEFMARLGELDEILNAREEALVRKIAQLSAANAKLEQMPPPPAGLTV